FSLLRLLDAIDADTWKQLFADSVAAVRELAVQVSPADNQRFPELMPALLAAADDASPRVRYLTALSLGDVSSPEAVTALAQIAARDGADKWTRAAVLSGVSTRTALFLETFSGLQAVDKAAFAAVMQDLGRLLGHGGTVAEAKAFFGRLVSGDKTEEWRISAMLGLAEGFNGRRNEIATSNKGLLYAMAGGNGTALDRFIHNMKEVATGAEAGPSLRKRAIALLGFTNYQQANETLRSLLDTHFPPDVQLEAVGAISRLQDPRGAELLTEKEKWSAFSPNVKPAVISALVSNKSFTNVLFSAIEKG